MNFKMNKGQLQAATILAFAATILMAPSAAFADEATLAGVTSFADTILDFMRGPIATAAGAIAIAVVGYRWFSGRMEMGRAVATVAGIVLVIGSVQIVGFIRTGAGLEAADGAAEGTLRYELPESALRETVLFSEQI